MQGDELKLILDGAKYLAEQAAFSSSRKRRHAAGRMLGGMVLTMSIAGYRREVVEAVRSGIRERPLRLLLNAKGLKALPSKVDLGFKDVSPDAWGIPDLDLDDDATEPS